MMSSYRLRGSLTEYQDKDGYPYGGKDNAILFSPEGDSQSGTQSGGRSVH